MGDKLRGKMDQATGKAKETAGKHTDDKGLALLSNGTVMGWGANAHGAVSFFEYEFDTGVLMPGQSFGHAFTKAGEYFYNDPIFPQSTGKIVVQ